MLYVITRTETYGEESDVYVYLDDYVPRNDREAIYRAAPATLENVTIELMVTAVEQALEGGNYHNLTFLPATLEEVLMRNVSREVTKEILFDWISNKGLLLGVR